MTDCLQLDPASPLSRHRERADGRLRAARDQRVWVQMLQVARLVRAALPEAAVIDLARDLFDFQDEVWLDAVRSGDGTALWHSETDSLAEFRYADGATWEDARDVIVDVLGQGLTGAAIAEIADHRPDWSRVSQSGLIELIRIELPSPSVVEHHTTTPPGPDEPRLEVVVDRDPDSATEVHAFIDGLPVLAELTDVDPGRGWALGDWREAAAEHAATASPTAVTLITRLFRQGESSEFVTA